MEKPIGNSGEGRFLVKAYNASGSFGEVYLYDSADDAIKDINEMHKVDKEHKQSGRFDLYEIVDLRLLGNYP